MLPSSIVEITDIKIKGKRNTKYKRKAISYIKRTEKLAAAIIERYGLDEFTRRYNEYISTVEKS